MKTILFRLVSVMLFWTCVSIKGNAQRVEHYAKDGWNGIVSYTYKSTHQGRGSSGTSIIYTEIRVAEGKATTFAYEKVSTRGEACRDNRDGYQEGRGETDFHFFVEKVGDQYYIHVDDGMPALKGTLTECGKEELIRNDELGMIIDLSVGTNPNVLVGDSTNKTRVPSGDGFSEEEVKISVNLTLNSNYEAFITPAKSDYKKWLPLGADASVLGSTGNSVDFMVFVKNKKTGEKKNSVIEKVEYTLEDVSNEPGFAMNYPSENAGNLKDLQLANNGESPDTTKENLNVAIEAKDDQSFMVRVHSLDYGSYGALKARVHLSTGEVLVAKWEEINQPYLLIPYRKNTTSQIADYWKEQNKAAGKSDSDDDEKDDDVGDHEGDGLSLYEEYRGFIENKKHIRTSALKKDVMVCNQLFETPIKVGHGLPATSARKRAEVAIALYEGVTHTKVHSKFLSHEFGRKEKVPADKKYFDEYHTKVFEYDKVINFNSSSKTHLVDQHGILMVSTADTLGYAAAVGKKDGDFDTPKNYAFLVITADFDPSPEGYSITRAELDPVTGTIKTNDTGKSKVITDYFAATVAHEMLHCSNVDHHGEIDYTDCSYTLSPDRSQIFFTGETEGKVHKFQVRLFDHGTKTEILPDSDRWKSISRRDTIKVVEVAVRGGQHSGDEDCMMKYDNAQAYTAALRDQNHYLLRSPKRFADGKKVSKVITGIGLCNSSKGTTLFGNASKGNCRKQFCINDKYH